MERSVASCQSVGVEPPRLSPSGVVATDECTARAVWGETPQRQQAEFAMRTDRRNKLGGGDPRDRAEWGERDRLRSSLRQGLVARVTLLADFVVGRALQRAGLHTPVGSAHALRATRGLGRWIDPPRARAAATRRPAR